MEVLDPSSKSDRDDLLAGLVDGGFSEFGQFHPAKVVIKVYLFIAGGEPKEIQARNAWHYPSIVMLAYCWTFFFFLSLSLFLSSINGGKFST